MTEIRRIRCDGCKAQSLPFGDYDHMKGKPPLGYYGFEYTITSGTPIEFKDGDAPLDHLQRTMQAHYCKACMERALNDFLKHLPAGNFIIF